MNHFRASALLILILLSIFLTPKLSLAIANSLLFMPVEFRTLKKTFEELSDSGFLEGHESYDGIYVLSNEGKGYLQ